MAELKTEDVKELLVGTWIGMALIADALIRARVLHYKDLLEPLAHAEVKATGNRRIPLTVLGNLTRRGFGASPCSWRPFQGGCRHKR